jgi:hypothetical protein
MRADEARAACDEYSLAFFVVAILDERVLLRPSMKTSSTSE